MEIRGWLNIPKEMVSSAFSNFIRSAMNCSNILNKISLNDWAFHEKVWSFVETPLVHLYFHVNLFSFTPCVCKLYRALFETKLCFFGKVSTPRFQWDKGEKMKLSMIMFLCFLVFAAWTNPRDNYVTIYKWRQCAIAFCGKFFAHRRNTVMNLQRTPFVIYFRPVWHARQRLILSVKCSF